MRRIVYLLFITSICFCFSFFVRESSFLVSQNYGLNIGDKAPSFSVKNYNGVDITLDSLKDSQFILWFFPKASTPG